MACTLVRIGDRPNVNVMEFAVDTESDIQNLPTTTTVGTGKGLDIIAPMGSTATVGNEDGDLLVYMLFSFGWKKI